MADLRALGAAPIGNRVDKKYAAIVRPVYSRVVSNN